MKKKECIYEIDRYCAYCENAVPVIGNTEMLCSYRGIVGIRHCCRKFMYDPLKRVPKRKNAPDPSVLPDDPS